MKTPDILFHKKAESVVLPYILASIAIFAVACICYLFQPFISYHSVALILLFTISVFPLFFRYGPVLLSAAISALIWNFFFIPPLFTFYIASLEDLLTFSMYFIISTITGILTSRIHKQERGARLREKRTQALYSMTRELSVAESLDEVIKIAINKLESFFNVDIILLLADDHGKLLKKNYSSNEYIINDEEYRIANWTFSNQNPSGKFTKTLSASEFKYYPLSTPRLFAGVVGLSSSYQFVREQEVLFQTFIYQIASAIEREILNEKAKKTLLLTESERLYETLFNSISHELKTPLATIMAATENLMDLNILKNTEISHQLVDEINIANNRLHRLVANLLDMSRLESGMLKLNLNWHDLSDLINQVLKSLKNELSNHPVSVKMEEDLPLVKIDFALIEQAISNILINCAHYTPSGSQILIELSSDPENLKLSISDNGPGFPEENIIKVFEKFYRLPGTGTGGTGLGLSITKGFIEAHNATITVQNRRNGGAVFKINFLLTN